MSNSRLISSNNVTLSCSFDADPGLIGAAIPVPPTFCAPGGKFGVCGVTIVFCPACAPLFVCPCAGGAANCDCFGVPSGGVFVCAKGEARGTGCVGVDEVGGIACIRCMFWRCCICCGVIGMPLFIWKLGGRLFALGMLLPYAAAE